MASAVNPFEMTPIEAQNYQPSTPEEDFDPIYRTPALRAESYESDELEREKLDMTDEEIIQLLNEYFDEAENARETGYEPRHEVWEQNLHAFWMRKDYPNKMDWQSREKSGFVPSAVERFAATHREALTYNPDWLEIKDRNDPTGELSRFATRLTRVALDFAGTNSSGQPVPFEHDFGNMVMTGALMKMCAAVQYDHRLGRCVAEQVDPRQCYLDPMGRGLYRVRWWEVDKETLLRQAELLDENGKPFYDKEAIESLVANRETDIITNREESSGAGQMTTSSRTPILIKEWLVDLIDRRDGENGKRIVRERQLIVTANDHTIIRGPEKNPWWHGKDWIVCHPVLQAPLKAVDGRTYVEIFRHSVETHENVTNRILDSVATSSMNAFEVNPDLLDDPDALMGGIAPNQTILRDPDAPPGERAVMTVEMGKPLSADIMTVWRETRRNMQEDAAQSDISLGQASRGETTATEVNESKAGQSSLNNSISIDIDMGFLGPVAELVYYCTLQHVSEKSMGIWAALSPEDQAMLKSRREEFRSRPIWVRAKGLTNAVQRSRRMRGLLGALNVVGGNPQLLAEFQKEYSMAKVVRVVLEDFGVPIEKIQLSPDEKFRLQDALRQQQAKTAADEEMARMMGGGAPGGQAGPGGGGAGGGGAGAPAQMAQALGGTDPLMPGKTEGLPGEIR